jgi:hypothetical protein
LTPCQPAPPERASDLYIFENVQWCRAGVYTNGSANFILKFLEPQTQVIQRSFFRGFDLNKEGEVELVEHDLELAELINSDSIRFIFDLPTFTYENRSFERRGFFVFQTGSDLNIPSQLWCMAINFPCELGTHVGSALDPSNSKVSSAPGTSSTDSVKITSESKANASHGLAGSTCGTMRSFASDSMNGMAIALFFILSSLAFIFSRRSKQKIAR